MSCYTKPHVVVLTQCPWASGVKPAPSFETLGGRMMVAATAQMYTLPHSTTPKLCCWIRQLTYAYNCSKADLIVTIWNTWFNIPISRLLFVQIIQSLDFVQCLQYDCKSGRGLQLAQCDSHSIMWLWCWQTYRAMFIYVRLYRILIQNLHISIRFSRGWRHFTQCIIWMNFLTKRWYCI